MRGLPVRSRQPMMRALPECEGRGAMAEVSPDEGARLADTLDRVEEVSITRGGVPIARLVPGLPLAALDKKLARAALAQGVPAA